MHSAFSAQRDNNTWFIIAAISCRVKSFVSKETLNFLYYNCNHFMRDFLVFSRPNTYESRISKVHVQKSYLLINNFVTTFFREMNNTSNERTS